MLFIVKHRKIRVTKKVQFNQGGWVIMYQGYINATNLKPCNQERLIKRMGFKKVDPKTVPLKRLKQMKVDINEVFKPKPEDMVQCFTDKCPEKFEFVAKRSRRKYCDKCQEEKKMNKAAA